MQVWIVCRKGSEIIRRDGSRGQLAFECVFLCLFFCISFLGDSILDRCCVGKPNDEWRREMPVLGRILETCAMIKKKEN